MTRAHCSLQLESCNRGMIIIITDAYSRLDTRGGRITVPTGTNKERFRVLRSVPFEYTPTELDALGFASFLVPQSALFSIGCFVATSISGRFPIFIRCGVNSVNCFSSRRQTRQRNVTEEQSLLVDGSDENEFCFVSCCLLAPSSITADSTGMQSTFGQSRRLRRRLRCPRPASFRSAPPAWPAERSCPGY